MSNGAGKQSEVSIEEMVASIDERASKATCVCVWRSATRETIDITTTGNRE